MVLDASMSKRKAVGGDFVLFRVFPLLPDQHDVLEPKQSDCQGSTDNMLPGKSQRKNKDMKALSLSFVKLEKTYGTIQSSQFTGQNLETPWTIAAWISGFVSFS